MYLEPRAANGANCYSATLTSRSSGRSGTDGNHFGRLGQQRAAILVSFQFLRPAVDDFGHDLDRNLGGLPRAQTEIETGERRNDGRNVPPREQIARRVIGEGVIDVNDQTRR